MTPDRNTVFYFGRQRFTMREATKKALKCEANKRQIEFGRLMGYIMDVVVEDDLISAILEDYDTGPSAVVNPAKSNK